MRLKQRRPDVRVENHGTIYLFRIQSSRAARWVKAQVQTEPWQWLGNGLSVDHRYARDLAAGMAADGLCVE